MKTEPKTILLVGCCGMGVGPLGLFLAGMGHRVYGYDDYPVESVMRRLEAAGIRRLEHLHAGMEVDEVILSRAVQCSSGRLERLIARFHRARICFRGEYLAELAKQFHTIVVAGTHGKTSTTALLVGMLNRGNVPCSHILGAFFAGDALPAAQFHAESRYLVVELDESDGTMEAVVPYATLLTNVELDHVDHYASEHSLKRAFAGLLERTCKASFLSHRAAQSMEWKEGAERPGLRCLPPLEGEPVMAENLQLAQAVAKWLGVSESVQMPEACPPVERRQELMQWADGTWVVTDYAHHPGELHALRQWCERRFPQARMHWVFQPHRYSRTAALKSGFVEVLAPLEPILLPAYAAFESRIPGGSAGDLHEALLAAGCRSIHPENPETLRLALADRLSQGTSTPGSPDVILFVGAGDIGLWRDWCVPSLRDTSQSLDARWLQFFENRVSHDGSRVALAEPLRRKTTLNVGGAARFYLEPASFESLQLTVKMAALLGLPLRILGKGSNLLIQDEGVDAVVVRLSQRHWCACESLGNGRFRVGAGLRCKRLSRASLEAGVGGFQFLDGIPGSLGGALWMNAGAMGSEIADCVVEVECMDLQGNRVRLARDEMQFAYRSCPSVRDLIVLHLVLEGQESDVREMEEQLESLLQWRLATQPAEPSAGCMFKNPVGDSAGRLIDAAGLKGYRIGGACISRKHANFLVTDRNTASDEVRALIEHTKNEVFRRFGVELEQEIQCFGSSGAQRSDRGSTPTTPVLS